jgi:hypothetical protein
MTTHTLSHETKEALDNLKASSSLGPRLAIMRPPVYWLSGEDWGYVGLCSVAYRP